MARSARPLFLLLQLAALLALAGCGPSGPSTLVSGSVTYKDKPVTGEITFIGPDGKDAKAPILDGKYSVANPPVGLNKIKITGMGGDLAPAGGGGKPPIPKDVGGKDAVAPTTSTVGAGVAPPAKYASPDNGLKYEVKAGTQTKDFPLEP